MALTDKLTAIADAIREKTGKDDEMTLAQMPDEISGITTADGGVTLPELENPASATDLASGKQLIGADGGIVTGTLPESGEGVTVFGAGDVGINGTQGSTLIHPYGIYQKDKIGDNSVGFICRPGTEFYIRELPTSLFGNASANQVAKGVTFTSEAGYLVEGTMEAGGGGALNSIMTVETVISTESFTNGAGVGSYVAPLFTSLDVKKLCFLQVLVVKDIEAAKQTNNGFLGAYSFSWGSQDSVSISRLLRWRDGGYSIAQNGNDWDVHLKSGTELYLVTIDFERLAA